MAEPDQRIGDLGARALADAIKELKGLKELAIGGGCLIEYWPSPRFTNETHAHRPPAIGVYGWLRVGWTGM